MSQIDQDLIVGGGPAAAACAMALIAAGRQVTLVETGLQLESERETARQRMQHSLPSAWSSADVQLTRFAAAADKPGGYKRLFGSDVAFRSDGVLDVDAQANVGARPSYAAGGLSNVWGAGLLPYREQDLRGWPIGAAELEPSYRQVLDFLPFSGELDELAERYPLFRTPDGPLLRTDAGEHVLARLRKQRDRLNGDGLYFGASRIAVRVGAPAPANGCIYCSHCLDGCPYGHIYCAAQTIAKLREQGAIKYLPGLHVERLSESDGVVSAHAVDLEHGSKVELQARRAFVAAGAVSTTIILQRSRLHPERAVIRDSQALYVPFGWFGRIGRTGRESGHTLAQASLVLEDQNVSEEPVHITLYTYNDGLAERARASQPRLAGLLGNALEGVLRHLIVGICFFHSDDSDSVSVQARPDSRRVMLEAVENPRTRSVAARFQRSLTSKLGRAGLLPLPGVSELAPAGGGYHYGASAPMRSQPTFGETDTLGRPAGSERIHVVDSTCFPTVPGGAITLTSMANADRIARATIGIDADD